MVDYLRKSSEALILFLVVVSPWAFGSVHAMAQYFLTAGVGLIMVFWAIELLIEPKRLLTRFQLPILILVSIVCLQLIPLGNMTKLLSPNTARLKAEMMPAQVETLADGTAGEIPFWTARGRISFYPAGTLRRCYWLVLMGLLFTRVQDLATVESLRRLCFACLINGSILSYFAVFQHFTTDEPGKIYWYYQSLGASFGPFIYRNHFAFYINICFGLSLGLVGSRLMGKVKSFRGEDVAEVLKDSFSLWMVSVLVFMLGAVILCSSRGGLISLFGSTLVTAVFIAATGSFQRSWKWFVLAALIFAAAAGIQTWLGFDFVDSRYAIHDDNRTTVWRPLLNLIPQFPVTGTGLGTLSYVEPLTRISNDRMDDFLENAHNEYLQLVLETGIPGLLCGLTLLGLLIAKIAGRIRSSRHNAWLYVGALFGLSSISLHSFAEFAFVVPAIALLAAVLFGHIAGLSRLKASDGPSSGIPARVFAVCVILIAIVVVRDAKQFDLAKRSQLLAERARKEGDTDQELQHYLNALAYVPDDAEILLDSTKIQLDPSRARFLKDQEYLNLVQQDLVRIRELCPLAAESHYLFAQEVEKFTRADHDLLYLDRALKSRSFDQTLWYIAGLAHLNRGDLEKATLHFRRSLALKSLHLNQILSLAVEKLDRDQISEQLVPRETSRPLMDAAKWFVEYGETLEPDAVAENDALVQRFREQALETAELRKPDSGQMHHRKAELLEQLNRPDEAISAYKMALNYEPQQYIWRLRLAALMGREKQYDEAHGQIKRLLQSRPGYAPAERLRDRLLKER